MSPTLDSSLLEGDGKGRSLWSDAFRRFRQNRGAMIGLAYVLFVVLAAIAASSITTHDPNLQDIGNALSPPSAENWFGTDHFGRDIYTRVVYGARVSLRVGPISTGIALLTGVPLGLLAAYYLGWIDAMVSRLIDVLLAFPGLLLAMGIMAILGPGLTNAMLATGISMLPRYVRVTRASTLSVKEMDYVMAARSVGASDGHIMARHLFPNVILPLIVLASLDIAGAILFTAGLSFLGLGAQPPTPDWGGMLARARVYMQDAPWFAFFPGLTITSTILALNMAGDGLRDALDPHLTVKEQ
jgi:peptide/nickel transport system permease protein